jgi:hypothetical protein
MGESKRYRLKLPILSVDPEQATTVLIPEGEVIEIDGRRKHRRMTDIVWNGRILRLFRRDLRDRCEEVSEL